MFRRVEDERRTGRDEHEEYGNDETSPGSESDETQGNGHEAPTRGTAPSAPDIKKLEKFEPSDEAKATEPSETDAMGKDKRREVIGHSYGPSRRSQILAFGGFFAVMAVLLIGGKMLADKADEPPETNPDQAPWSAPDAPQRPGIRPQ